MQKFAVREDEKKQVLRISTIFHHRAVVTASLTAKSEQSGKRGATAYTHRVTDSGLTMHDPRMHARRLTSVGGRQGQPHEFCVDFDKRSSVFYF